LRLLHPFTPYVTEELWQHLKKAVKDSPYDYLCSEWGEALIIASWPEPRPIEDWEESKVKDFLLLQDIVKTIRNLRAEKNIKPGKLIPANLVSEEYAQLLNDELSSLATLAQLDKEQVTINTSKEGLVQGQIALVAGPIEIYLPLSGLLDIAEEKERISKELKETENQIDRLEALLSSPFSKKAPKDVIEKEKEKLTAYKETAATLMDQLSNIQESD
jgi:valyl-tRNA synthetase